MTEGSADDIDDGLKVGSSDGLVDGLTVEQ